MEPSLFQDYVGSYFPRLVMAITEEINGQKLDQGYYFRRFLGREWSLTGKWESLAVANSRIMADVIAMDSSIPLKKRPTLSAASGEIPKLGMELALNETDLTHLQMLTQLRDPKAVEAQILEMLFRDTATVIRGQYERIEAMFLEGLSRGVVEVSKNRNVGAEVRLNFQYPAANQFNATLPWLTGGAPTANVNHLDDLMKLVKKASADGNPIRVFMLDDNTMQQILNSDSAKQIFAQANNASAVLFAPTLEQLNQAVKSKWGYTFEVVNRVSRYQIDGVDYDYNPWEAGQIIGFNNNALGKLVWSTLAEMNAPVGGVTYQRADQFILASKYRVNRPSLAEFTNSQSRAVPVIGATQQIYKLDTTQGTAT